ncbi:MAG TPA: bifunctional methylenetetrahydrofolate dehydrogenase/methenyltetrahydrofolate cyclohydrolase FolD [Marinilabiliales bacterium]|jgi:methylenetetrahydrofolate dehydrogenase (NADP+)/methenyltetrahydrofolate cyclohydrolase|nr:bifunctional methylenetetrahydrofolate dehydrogenase/methenyltetrahydrofolate cyclohydrolase FolD [Marinilabiliales bacterium]HAZ02663.1 bifunctional methylenetetrahydrofolate dehydrogenase/methenyltetrahydrofolate cyclohydrolase FolD [Marinilabiliales bacterium]HBO76085.1 bifunctional methylenetetrahydrofolate dehydrogenase/methenyltetrahydrofolate cyclohydrolase FolD [Marinilabiliales bacterium]HBX86282.1 bifunctional methylenetetrahydrofolate dehydrogenase/methenyltetrahydrofolate cyclohyd
MILLDGKKISEEVKQEIAQEVNQMVASGQKRPNLAVIMVGDEGASATYVASKIKTCREVGFDSTDIHYPASVTEEEVLQKIRKINTDPTIDGLIVQLPLPKHISESKVIETIDYRKDVDGFHPINTGRMAMGLPSYLPATPAGIIEMLRRYNIETDGKNCVVLGRSNIVGTPISLLMSRKANPGNATVTICHSRTQNLKAVCAQADILIVAIGQPEFVTADMVKPGAVVIDVGIHRMPSTETKSGFKLKGDVKFDEVAPKSSYITPVPGGVGLMTIICLLQNTLLAAQKKIYP